jgi:hypothetical protein
LHEHFDMRFSSVTTFFFFFLCQIYLVQCEIPGAFFSSLIEEMRKKMSQIKWKSSPREVYNTLKNQINELLCMFKVPYDSEILGMYLPLAPTTSRTSFHFPKISGSFNFQYNFPNFRINSHHIKLNKLHQSSGEILWMQVNGEMKRKT